MSERSDVLDGFCSPFLSSRMKGLVRIMVPDEHRDRNYEILKAAAEAAKMLRRAPKSPFLVNQRNIQRCAVVYFSRTIKAGPPPENCLHSANMRNLF